MSDGKETLERQGYAHNKNIFFFSLLDFRILHQVLNTFSHLKHVKPL